MSIDGLLREALRVADTVAPAALAIGGGYLGLQKDLEQHGGEFVECSRMMLGASAGVLLYLLKEFVVDVWQDVQKMQSEQYQEFVDSLEREGGLVMRTYIPRSDGRMTVISHYALQEE